MIAIGVARTRISTSVSMLASLAPYDTGKVTA